MSCTASDETLSFAESQHDCVAVFWRAWAVAVHEGLSLFEREPGFGEDAIECWVAVSAFSGTARGGRDLDEWRKMGNVRLT